MAFTNIKSTQVAFLESYLRGTGREISAAQAQATYGIRNLSARISELRAAGLRVRKSVNTVGSTTYAVSRRDVFNDQSRLYS
jgi:hypothetical protein